MVKLDGKVAIVTGGSRGIGTSISRELAANGVKVVINYNTSREAAEQVVRDIEDAGGTAFASQADVSDIAQSRILVEDAINKYGRLDILVNNAGITKDRTFRKLTPEDWKQVIDVNLSSLYNMTSASLSHILESDAGRIVNISSIIGQAGGYGQTNYAAAKAGIIGFTKSLALELAKTGVTVNAICPGFIETDMVAAVPEEIRQQIISKIPVKRFGKPEEIARGVVYLCQDGAFITGHELSINGGMHM
jgi:acetoacetyl-CoA reductase